MSGARRADRDETGRSRRSPDGGMLLLLTPLLWGATFPAAKIALRRLPVPAFMAWSRVLGLLAILILLPLLRRAGDQPRRSPREAIRPALILGGFMLAGYFLQTEGLDRTTATNAGFITGLYVVFTPLLAAIAFGHRLQRTAWLAVLVSVLGLALLSTRDLGTLRPHAGDLLVLGGAVAWAGHIVAVGHFSPKFPPWMLALGQMAAAAALQVLAAIPDGLHPGAALDGRVWGMLVLTGVIGSGVAFTIQVMAQQTISTTRAVILLAGEGVFSAAFSAVWIGERLSAHQWLGAALVLAAMSYSELSARRPPVIRLDPASAP